MGIPEVIFASGGMPVPVFNEGVPVVIVVVVVPGTTVELPDGVPVDTRD